jgi:cytoskeletal protein RodZ
VVATAHFTMVYATRSRIVAILLLCFCVNVVVADRWAIHLHRRDGPTTSSTSVSDSTSQPNQPSQTASNGDGGSSTTQNSASKVSITTTINSTTSSTSASTTSTTAATITPIPSNLNGATPTSALNLNYTGYNCMAIILI